MIKKLKRAYPKSPTIEPTLLPYLSEIGPPKICPIANPIKNIDKDSSTLWIFTSKYFAISGIDGKYVISSPTFITPLATVPQKPLKSWLMMKECQ